MYGEGGYRGEVGGRSNGGNIWVGGWGWGEGDGGEVRVNMFLL